MPIELKPLFRPDALRSHLKLFRVPDETAAQREVVQKWADLLATDQGTKLREQELLREFIGAIFGKLLGYESPAENAARYTLAPEKHIQANGKYADAVLGEFKADAPHRPIIALEGKGPKDPLDRPFAGRKKSAVEQGYGYAINLPCDWIIVTSMVETRLYHKGSDQQTCERFHIDDLATSDAAFRKFVFLLGAARVVPLHGDCHFYELKVASEKIGQTLTKKYYLEYANIRQEVFETLCKENETESPHALLSATQKLLDRVLFTAFCEDRGLLPDDTLKGAFEHSDPYNPRPIWSNFKGLFRSIDAGNPDLNIPPYNGGLFADDPFLEGLNIPDAVCGYFRDLGEYEYRPPSEVAADAEDDTQGGLIDVEILGHIFEQSITDLEQLRNELDGLVKPVGKEKHKTRRKKEGAFYTPEFITRYIIQQSLGAVLSQRFETLRQSHAKAAKGTASKVLIDPEVYEVAALNKPQREALVNFWEGWQNELETIRILDPACGSGAFLIEAFDQLYEAYQNSNETLVELRGKRLFDPDKTILENNLYGVDLSDEAIEICRLSLWIKTAKRGKQLTSLDHSIRVGNSVVTDPKIHPKAFDWKAAFPEVFAGGGFDVVVGNPPYVRQEWLKPYKEHWEKEFTNVYAGTADIYVYFFAQGYNLLREQGRMAFISSNAFVRASYAKNLRNFLVRTGGFSEFIDFGDTRVFQDAKDVYPAITVLTNDPSTVENEVRTMKFRRSDDPALVSDAVKIQSWLVPTERLADNEWHFEHPTHTDLRDKLRSSSKRLATYLDERNANICRGVVTGFNEGFVIDTTQRNALVARDSEATNIIKPFLRGQDIKRWYVEPTDQWLVFSRRGIEIEKYPSVLEYLQQFQTQLEPKPRDWGGGKWPGRKPGQYKWYEIQDSVDYWPAFESPKIIYPDIAKSNRFTMELTGSYSANTAYVLPVEDWFLLGVLNTKPIWFSFAGISIPFGERAGEFRYRFFSQYVEQLPIPDANDADREAIATLAKSCNQWGAEMYDLQEGVRRRLLQAWGELPDGSMAGKLNNKAKEWWTLTLIQLGAALKTSFKLTGNPFKNPENADQWESYLSQRQKSIHDLQRKIADAETELNDRVYHLFDLTADEIELLQREVEH